ncbi:hypothetical protein AMJ49_00860 [Parcubacteria bacterium DG_74_2]|nr:MAG: hypothetical protein AMJ49_00860 [Parcubacteria bacterium DG_74_2]
MHFIIGLGNPTRKYQKTRHNVGFRVLDKFLKKNKFSKFKFSRKFNSMVSKGFFNKKEVILVKPKTFMNLSGSAVKKLSITYSSLPTELFVIHDDLDLPLGEIKISFGRGSAGHKGVQSIIDKLGTKNFVRFRVGIRPATSDKRQATEIEGFVLQKFNKEEEKILKKAIKKTVEAIKFSLKEGFKKAMNEFNKSRSENSLLQGK